MSAKQPDPQVLHERLLFGGLTALLSVLGLAIPVLLYAAPVPLGVLTYRQGMQVGTVAALVAGLLTGIFFTHFGFVIVILLLALGLALGGSLREGMPPAQSLALGTVVTLIVFSALFVTAQSLFGINLIDDMFKQWQGIIGPDFEQVLAPVRAVFPAMIAMSAALITFFNMLGIRKVLVRLGNEMPWFPPFRTWRFPLYLALTYVAVQVASSLASASAAAAILANVHTVLYYVFLLQGVSVVVFYTTEWGLNRFITIVLAVFASVIPLGQIAAVLLGLVDAAANLRRLPASGRDSGH